MDSEGSGGTVHIHSTQSTLQEAKKVSDRVSLWGKLRLVRVNTLRRVHNVGFSRDGSYVIRLIILVLIKSLILKILRQNEKWLISHLLQICCMW